MDACTFEQLLQWMSGPLDSVSIAKRQQLATALDHGSLRQQTSGIIESAAAPNLTCPRCGARHLHKHGYAHGLRRFRCVRCGRTFNGLTGTPLARLHHKDKWLPYLADMLTSATVRTAAHQTGIHRNTSFRWRHRFLDWTRCDRILPLRGIVGISITCMTESQKGARPLPRPARTRSAAAVLSSIASTKVCIVIARDRAGRTVDAVTGPAPLSWSTLRTSLDTLIAPGCVMVAGACRANAKLIGVDNEDRSLVHCAKINEEWKLQAENVDAYAERFMHWLGRFHGVATRYLTHYLGWFWAIDSQRIAMPQQLLRAALTPRPTASYI